MWAIGEVFERLGAITGLGIGCDEASGRMQVLFCIAALHKEIGLLEIAGLRLWEA